MAISLPIIASLSLRVEMICDDLAIFFCLNDLLSICRRHLSTVDYVLQVYTAAGSTSLTCQEVSCVYLFTDMHTLEIFFQQRRLIAAKSTSFLLSVQLCTVQVLIHLVGIYEYTTRKAPAAS